ncbi:MAG TPA: hypothetical protein VIK33_00265 [Anaerolineae bacterium]
MAHPPSVKSNEAISGGDCAPGLMASSKIETGSPGDPSKCYMFLAL